MFFPIQFVIRRGKTLARHALIVATDPDSRLKGVERDAVQVKETLLKLGFENKDIIVLDGPMVTRNQVIAAFNTMAQKSEERSLFIFHYSGHGSPDGRLVVREPGPKLNVAQIQSLIALIKGNKLAIIDCCFAKRFKDLGKIENCAFMGASQENQVAYERAKEGGIFTEAVVRTFNDALNRGDNYIRIARIEKVEGFKTSHNPGHQAFTLTGSVCFTARLQ